MFPAGHSDRITPHEFVERLKTLIESNVAGNTQLLTRFVDLIGQASQAGSKELGNQPDAEAMLSRWLDFNLAAYSIVSTQGLALLNGLLSAARSTLITKAEPVPDVQAATASNVKAATEPRVELRLSGRHGERATAGFVIENHFDAPLEVRFESTALTPAIGPALAASLVSFEPTTLKIPPRGQGVVQTIVAITTDFVVGQTYRATIRPLGFGAKELGLSVTIEPPTPEVLAPPRAASQPRQPQKKRTQRGKK
jgi:hypothetical protein